MNIDKALKGLKEMAPRESAADIEAGRQRLRAAARRLREDPLEARRIDELAKRIGRREKDYRLAHEALRKQDFGTAENSLRRSAHQGNDEAAYWLAVLLVMASMRQRLRGHAKKARKLAAEAREWRLRAQDSGIAEALDRAYLGDNPSLSELHAGNIPVLSYLPVLSEEPWQNHEQSAPRVREEVATPRLARAAARREDGYAVGIELLPYQFTVVLVNVRGEIVSEEARGLSDMEPEAVVHVLAAAARETVASTLGHEFPASQVVLGVQLGGPVDTKTGTVHYYSKHPPTASSRSSEFRWEDFPLGPPLQQESGFETIILNDTVAFAERELWFGVGRQTGDFVVMLIREGVGGAIVSDGKHFKGPVEIGNFRFSSDSVRQADTGLFGVLELTSGITGLTESASELIGRPLADVEAAAAAADEDGPGQAASAAFLSAGVAIACGLSYLVQVSGPSHAVLYAPEILLRPDSRAGRRFLGQVKRFTEAVAFKAYRNCDLVLRPTGPTDGAEGAALVALNRCFQVQPATAPVSTGA